MDMTFGQAVENELRDQVRRGVLTPSAIRLDGQVEYPREARYRAMHKVLVDNSMPIPPALTEHLAYWDSERAR